MIDQLRAFLNRPLRDSDRRTLFIAAVAVILAAAAGFALIDRPDQARRPAASGPARSGSPAPSSAQPAPRAVLQAPSEEGRQPASLQASRTEVRHAKRAARRFLAGYLPYTYAQLDARRIAAATNELRRRLITRPPRVPVSERRRRPRLVLLQTDGIGPLRGTATAVVDDGARRYTVSLLLGRQRAGWKVADVGG